LRRYLREDIAQLEPYIVQRYPDLIKMDANENPFDLPPELKEMICLAFRKTPTNRYPDGDALELRKAIAERSFVELDQIVMGNGSDELIGHIVTLFASSQAKVVYPVPTFSMYGIISRSLGVQTGEVPLDESFDVDLDRMMEELDGRPNILFLSYPNNPTGNCFDEKAILALLERDDTLVVVDEAYFEFSGKSFLPMLDRFDNLVILRTFSKAYGLAGLRVGYMIADVSLAEQVNKVRLPYNLNVLSQMAALKALAFEQEMAERIQLIISERDRLSREMSGIEGVRPFPSEANFILFRVSDASRCFQGLIDRGILIRNLDSGPLRGCLRVTVGTPRQNDLFLEALRDCVS
jgi:histidinol-phosphate aminotransferase